jgi:hypothetical protein
MNAIAQRSLPKLLEDAHSAAQRLSIATRSWPTSLPNGAALDEALNAAEGLKRTLNELRPHEVELNTPRRTC